MALTWVSRKAQARQQTINCCVEGFWHLAYTLPDIANIARITCHALQLGLINPWLLLDDNGSDYGATISSLVIDFHCKMLVHEYAAERFAASIGTCDQIFLHSITGMHMRQLQKLQAIGRRVLQLMTSDR